MRPGLLCVANFPSNTGYAWDFIECLYAGLADRLAPDGVATWVAYPAIPEPPRTLAGSVATPVTLEFRPGRPRSLVRLLGFIRARGIGVLYLSDRPVWHPVYAALRLWGVRRIIVHDHTSGARTAPTGLKRLAKRLLRRIPGTLADRVIAVSDYVVRRKVEVDLVPPERVIRLWNSIQIPAAENTGGAGLRDRLGLPTERPLIACACRAAPQKGLGHLLRAFDRLVRDRETADRPLLVHLGDGPAMPRLERIRDTLAARDDIILAGYIDGAAALLGDADLCVVPSVWEEAFGLAALEPMARGVPVIASRVGGIPEVVVDDESGVLVPPGDESALEAAMRRLLDSPDERSRLGEAGRRRAARLFSRERQLDKLTELFSESFADVRRQA